MNTIAIYQDLIEFNRTRTLGTLDDIAKQPDPAAILGFRPGPGRAHIAWQLMHIGITEELFATERLIAGATPAYADLVPRFKGGSTPDDNIPDVGLIRQVLTESRRRLLGTLSKFTDDDLSAIFPWFKERLDILACAAGSRWHESHHQGQAHISYNLWKAKHAV